MEANYSETTTRELPRALLIIILQQRDLSRRSWVLSGESHGDVSRYQMKLEARIATGSRSLARGGIQNRLGYFVTRYEAIICHNYSDSVAA